MINLCTPVTFSACFPKMTHGEQWQLWGSCFAENIGRRLLDAKFQCDVNPFGILYNPLSISEAIRQVLTDVRYQESHLFFHQGCWHSSLHHGDFSAADIHTTLENINSRLKCANNALANLRGLLITWGTAWVYEDKEMHRIVGNCHKLPEKHFVRRRLEVEEIVADYQHLLDNLFQLHPELPVIITISPIRHLRDGLYENRLSKSTLFLALDRLKQLYPSHIFYFPAYEIMMDELRDYRFYAEDMVHPSPLAVQYIWEKFLAQVVTPKTLDIIGQCEQIAKSIAHRPIHPDTEEYHRFIQRLLDKINQLNSRFPYLDFENEIKICHTRLNTLQK